jgi:hypothetical protein
MSDEDGALAKILAWLREEPEGERVPFHHAAKEIADALNIKYEAATMTLFGLCATGNVRWVDDSGEVIDDEAVTVAKFGGKVAFVIADDVRHHLAEWSAQPLRSHRDQVIEKLIAEDHRPPRSIDWKSFYKLVRDDCRGWLADGRPAHGFGDKQIQRAFKDLMAK